MIKLAALVTVLLLLGTLPLHAQQLPAPFHRHQTYPIPSGGVAADFDPTALRWPFEKGKNVQYDVRLSQDSTFRKEPVYGQEKTEWAMYNPHQKLGTGTWYWQYRKTGGTWSKLIHFNVTTQALPLVSPPPATLLAAVPKDHPRLLAHGAEIAALRNRPKNEDMRAILAEAEEALKQPLPKEDEGIADKQIDDELKNKQVIKLASLFLGNRVYYNVASLCQAYTLTGDERFAEKALAIGREVVPWDPDKVTRLSDFGDSRFMMALALIYDTFYDRLTPAERETFRNSIRIRLEEFYHDWKNNIEVRVLSAHVWQHILHYFFQSALVLQGDEPEASLWLSYAYELFLTRSPILGGNDGGWVNGASYFRMNMETLLDIPMFIKKYTGFDFVNAHPWYKNQIDWMVYGMSPGSAADGFGDNNETIKKPGIEYVAFAEEIAKLTRYPMAAWYADRPVNWSWLIHSMKKINLDAVQNQFTARFDNSTGQGGLWSTLPIEWAAADTFEIPAVNVIGRVNEDGEVIEYDDNQWHLKATNKVKSSQMRFLSVVQVGAPGGGKPSIESSVAGEKVTVGVGDWQVSAQLGLGSPAELKISDAQTSFSTGGSVQLAGKTYQGTTPGSTKLVELRKDKTHFQEVIDELPLSVQRVLLSKKSECKK